MRRIQGCSGISSETLLIYLVLISHGNEEALAFSAPHSLTHKADIPVLAPRLISTIKDHTETCYIFLQLCSILR